MSYEKNAVGIDVSNGRSTVSVLRPFGEVVVLPFNVQHTTEEPLLIKQYGNNSLRNVKTDKADSMKIARYALDNWAELRDYTPMDTIRYDLKTLHRQFNLSSKQKTAANNNLVSLTEQVFPGIRKIFESPVRKDGTQKWERLYRALPKVVQTSRLPFQGEQRRRSVRTRKNCHCTRSERFHY